MMRTLPTVLGIMLAAASAAQAQGRGAWFADPKTGCKFFENDPVPGETVAWTGPCVKGVVEGHGTLDIFVKGKLDQHFEGDMRAGKANGRAIIRFSNGNTYTGGMLDNMRQGHAVLTWPDGSRFEGEYAHDERNGHGVYAWHDGRRFEGEYRNDKANGQGTLVMNGQTYKGNWVNGCLRNGNLSAFLDTTKEACGFK